MLLNISVCISGVVLFISINNDSEANLDLHDFCIKEMNYQVFNCLD